MSLDHQELRLLNVPNEPGKSAFDYVRSGRKTVDLRLPSHFMETLSGLRELIGKEVALRFFEKDRKETTASTTALIAIMEDAADAMLGDLQNNPDAVSKTGFDSFDQLLESFRSSFNFNFTPEKQLLETHINMIRFRFIEELSGLPKVTDAGVGMGTTIAEEKPVMAISNEHCPVEAVNTLFNNPQSVPALSPVGLPAEVQTVFTTPDAVHQAIDSLYGGTTTKPEKEKVSA